MKRLLALIMTFLFAASNNVSYQTSDYSVYTPESYYRIEGNEAPDYRYMFENYTMLQSDGKCVGSSTDLRDKAQTIHLSENSAFMYWFDSNATSAPSADDLKAMAASYSYAEGGYIICPRDLVVKTKGSDGGGHIMDLVSTDGKWKVHIAGMERWFCCRRRTIPDGQEPADYTWLHTTDTYEYKIPRGYMIGVALQGTTITVSKADGTAVTMMDFYNP